SRADADASVFDAATDHAPVEAADEVPPSLVAARRLVINTTTARSLHFRVRPALVEMADTRLRARHGFGLDSPRAAEVVGEPLWSIVRPDARPPDHDDAALTFADVAVVLDRLESL